jgi:hypothetical protein
MMIFTKIKSNDQSPYDLSGNWLIKYEANTDNSYSTIATESNVSICDGAIYKYAVSKPYSIKF